DVDMQWNGAGIAGWHPGQARPVHHAGDGQGQARPDRRTDHPDEPTLHNELPAYASAAYAHGPDRADLISSLHYVHGHGVDHGEEHDDTHHQRNEKEDRAEESDDLTVERRQLAKVTHLEFEMVVLDEPRQASPCRS